MERTADVVTLGALGILSTALYAVAVPIATWLGKEPLACHPAVVAALFLLYLGAVWLIGRRLASTPRVVAVILGFAVLFRALMLTTPRRRTIRAAAPPLAVRLI